MNLYLLRFKDEPLFKVGITERLNASRWLKWGLWSALILSGPFS
jgi:hypothetical protein